MKCATFAYTSLSHWLDSGVQSTTVIAYNITNCESELQLKNQMAAGGTYETYSFHEQAQKRFTMKCATFACTLVSHWLESSRQLSSHTILQTAKV